MLLEFYIILETIIVNSVWVAAILGYTGMLYVLVRILEGVGYGNII